MTVSPAAAVLHYLFIYFISFKILKTNYNVALHMLKLWVLRVIKHFKILITNLTKTGAKMLKTMLWTVQHQHQAKDNYTNYIPG